MAITWPFEKVGFGFEIGGLLICFRKRWLFVTAAVLSFFTVAGIKNWPDATTEKNSMMVVAIAFLMKER